MMPSLRTLLVLGRTSNLPTVWSNCLAGWWLAGHDHAERLPILFLAATLLYVAGMFLNDAFDASFDAQYRRERPIPSGSISVTSVWQIGFGLMLAGLGLLFDLGEVTGLMGVCLVVCILIYDAVHKLLTLSPVIMAGCRFFLYLVAASITTGGINGWSVWCSLALAAYIVGLSFIARKEATQVTVNYWQVAFLIAPIVLALLMNGDGFRESAWLLSIVLALWAARSLRFAFRVSERNIGRTVSGLLAGIVLVDLLAVADISRPFMAVFVALLLLALFFQRFIPAT